jgi:hypothetical protein
MSTYSFVKGRCLHRPRKISCFWVSPRVLRKGPSQIHLHVHELKNPRVVESKDTLNDQDVRRIDGRRSVRTGMFLKRIHGDFGTFSTGEGVISYDKGWYLSSYALTRL